MAVRLILAIIFCGLAGCAVAPFATEHSASPLGEGRNALDTGFSPAPYAQFSRGVTPEIDLGGGVEVQFGYSIYAWGKFNLLTPPPGAPGKKIVGRSRTESTPGEGFSIAAVGGGGIGASVIDTMFVFLGPIASYRKDSLEFYLHPRLNYLQYEKFDATDDDGEDEVTDGFKADGGSFTYVQISAGAQVFVSPQIGLGISGLMFPPAPGQGWDVAPGLNALFRF